MLTEACILLNNPCKPGLKPVEVIARADTSSLHLCISEHIRMQLELAERDKRVIVTADGQQHRCAYVGPLEIKWKNRRCFTGALVWGESVRLGVIALNEMDLV